MIDPRVKKLAKVLVHYSCGLKRGEKILIEARGVDYSVVSAILEEVEAAGGLPFVSMIDNRVQRSILKMMTKELADEMAKFDGFRMSEMNAYIGIRGGNNCYESGDVEPQRTQIYDKYYSHPVHHELRVGKTKWVVLRYPTEGMSQLARMSTDAFEDFYFKVCTLDYGKMDRAMDSLCKLIAVTDKVRIVAKDTDLSFSIKGMGSEKCSGLRNIPDGEVYTAPVRDSVNGYIHYNVPSIEKGIEFNDVRLTFKNGKIIEATANHTELANSIFDTDEGARYVGEFAFGLNPYITEPIGDILFDEKISGSIHFTPGSCYDDVYNGNKSAIHWDLVQVHTPKYGGGEIYFDGKLIRKDGRFVLPELMGLNPENLM
ncbi:MAG: aminopeptidase [Clostridiales bacterium]|jgi:aminopeptidase|nr:aminopeptidase [Clostridiales bacterium]HOK81766.1 aminopeptidase [Clostridia bacterium]HOL60796.1 aminopeptidase [Clostridia bacterium]HPO53492.1 aminopeptidase [Clostridia bacterium]